MTSKNNDEAQFIDKKVGAYPFLVSIDVNGQKYKADVLKLVLHGVIVDLKNSILGVGSKVSLELFLPLDFGVVRAEGKVIKTYDHFVGDEESRGKAKRMAELHFTQNPLPEAERLKVKEFLKGLKKIGTHVS